MVWKRSTMLSFALVCASLAIAAYAVTTSTYMIRNVGAVEAVGVGVYWNFACTMPVSSINWGSLEPGSVKNVTIYIRNEGASLVTLMLSTDGWNPPEASKYLKLSWDYMGQFIAEDSIIPVTFSLQVAPNVQGVEGFSFTIIVASQA